MIKLLFPFAFLFILTTSCSKDIAPNPDDIIANCDSTSITYNIHIKPILDNSCALSGCHDALMQYGGYDFSDYPNAKRSMTSYTLDCINHRNGASPMPYQASKLSDSLIVQIETWVATGYCE